jgi:hypothetical protein
MDASTLRVREYFSDGGMRSMRLINTPKMGDPQIEGIHYTTLHYIQNSITSSLAKY